MADIELFLDNDNELKFDIQVEGAHSANFDARLILERSDGVNFGFKGTQDPNGEISVIIPEMTKSLAEGTYASRLEVIVDDRIFIPLVMQAELKKSLKVEAKVNNIRRRIAPKIQASIISEKENVSPQPPAVKKQISRPLSRKKNDKFARLTSLLKEIDSLK